MVFLFWLLDELLPGDGGWEETPDQRATIDPVG